jgi:hypothetical protein
VKSGVVTSTLTSSSSTVPPAADGSASVTRLRRVLAQARERRRVDAQDRALADGDLVRRVMDGAPHGERLVAGELEPGGAGLLDQVGGRRAALLHRLSAASARPGAARTARRASSPRARRRLGEGVVIGRPPECAGAPFRPHPRSEQRVERAGGPSADALGSTVNPDVRSRKVRAM